MIFHKLTLVLFLLPFIEARSSGNLCGYGAVYKHLVNTYICSYSLRAVHRVNISFTWRTRPNETCMLTAEYQLTRAMFKRKIFCSLNTLAK